MTCPDVPFGMPAIGQGKPPPGNGSRPDVTWTRWVLAPVAVLAPFACGLRAAESRRQQGRARERERERERRRVREILVADGIAVGRACEACRGQERHHGLDVSRGDRSCCPDRRGVRASYLRAGRAHRRRADAARVGGAARLSGRASADTDRALCGLWRAGAARAWTRPARSVPLMARRAVPRMEPTRYGRAGPTADHRPNGRPRARRDHGRGTSAVTKRTLAPQPSRAAGGRRVTARRSDVASRWKVAVTPADATARRRREHLPRSSWSTRSVHRNRRRRRGLALERRHAPPPCRRRSILRSYCMEWRETAEIDPRRLLESSSGSWCSSESSVRCWSLRRR
jgi:hypothetical protein